MVVLLISSRRFHYVSRLGSAKHTHLTLLHQASAKLEMVSLAGANFRVAIETASVVGRRGGCGGDVRI